MCSSLSAVLSSSGSTPVNAPKRIAASRTVRTIGPALSVVWEIGIIPLRLHNPTVGFRPTIPFALDGQTIEPFVSVPIVRVLRFADAATPGPELEPQGFRVISYGLFT